MLKRLRRIVGLALAIVLVTVSTLSASAKILNDHAADYQARVQLLHNMTDEECVQFIVSLGVEISDSDYPQCGEFVRKVINKTIENPDSEFVFGSAHYRQFADDIKTAINNYLGITNISQVGGSGISPNSVQMYTLQDSELYVPWNISHKYYNCYGYAIDYLSWIHPGFISSSPNGYDDSLPVSELAYYTGFDLIKLGCCGIGISSAAPAYYSNEYNYICVRKGSNYPYDFHYMKFNNGYWYHKPGDTAILRYKYIPNNNIFWTNEAISENGAVAPMYVYDSQIYYIRYRPSHTYSYTYTGNNYHSGTYHYYEYAYVCNYCGSKTDATWTSVSCSGPPCQNWINKKVEPAAIKE